MDEHDAREQTGGSKPRMIRGRPFMSVAEAKPEIAGEAHGWDPATVDHKFDKKRPWRCPRGHIYQATPKWRTAPKGTGCPYCSGRLVIPGETSLLVKFPDIAPEAHGWDPDLVTAGSHTKRLWKCLAKGHVWSASPNERTGRASKKALGCPCCSGKRVAPGENDLLTLFPAVAAQADGWDPSTVTGTSGKRKRWKCYQGHTWESTVCNRTTGRTGCPTCWKASRDAGHLVQKAEERAIATGNTLADVFPELAAQAHGWDPAKVPALSDIPREWICELGHVWKTTPHSRGGGRAGCPYCGGKKVLTGFNDLATKFPAVAAEAHGWCPSTISPGSHKALPWRCGLGHVWKAVVSNRTINKTSCPYCAQRRILPGFNDLATKFPAIAAEAHGWDPSKVSSGSHKPRQWKCPIDHIYMAAPGNRTGQDQGCPFCSNTRVLAGYNDLKTVSPSIAAEAHGWDPSTVTPGSDQRREWKCELGHIWKATPRARRKTGCPYCSTGGGFDIGSPGYLYWVEDGTRAKIGIANHITKRVMTEHKRNGWTHFQKIGPLPGLVVKDLERAIKAELAAKGVPTGRAAFREDFDGRSEAWNKVDVPESVAGLAGLIEWLGIDVGAIASESTKLGVFIRTKPRKRATVANTMVSLTCPVGHQYSRTLQSHRAGAGCPYCASVQVLPGFNDLKSKFPAIASEADGWNPEEVLAGSSKLFQWRCNKGHRWLESCNSRTSTEDPGCMFCKGKRLASGDNDLMTKHPEIGAQAHGWDPTGVLPSCGKWREWRCPIGHIWRGATSARVLLGRECQVCSGKQVVAGINDLATRFPEVARQAEGWDPSTSSPFSKMRRRWQCDKGHTWEAAVCNRTSQGQGCPVCFRQDCKGFGRRIAEGKLKPGENDLATKFPLIAREADGWDPTQVAFSSNKKKPWKCANGHRWTQSPNARVNRTLAGRPCKQCKKSASSQQSDRFDSLTQRDLFPEDQP